MKIFKSAILIAALMSSSSALANPSGWRFSEVSGNVTVTRDGRVLVARDRAVLHEGDEVRTAVSSRAVLVRGEEYVVVSPRSHIQIARPQEAGVVTQVMQYLGNVLFNIEKKSTPHFGVETPYMAAVVKGTTFNVSVTEEGTSVQVTEGAVEVATGDDLEVALLRPGMVGLVNADDLGSLVVVLDEQGETPNEGIIIRGKPEVVGRLRQAAAKVGPIDTVPAPDLDSGGARSKAAETTPAAASGATPNGTGSTDAPARTQPQSVPAATPVSTASNVGNAGTAPLSNNAVTGQAGDTRPLAAAPPVEVEDNEAAPQPVSRAIAGNGQNDALADNLLGRGDRDGRGGDDDNRRNDDDDDDGDDDDRRTDNNRSDSNDGPTSDLIDGNDDENSSIDDLLDNDRRDDDDDDDDDDDNDRRNDDDDDDDERRGNDRDDDEGRENRENRDDDDLGKDDAGSASDLIGRDEGSGPPQDDLIDPVGNGASPDEAGNGNGNGGPPADLIPGGQDNGNGGGNGNGGPPADLLPGNQGSGAPGNDLLDGLVSDEPPPNGNSDNNGNGNGNGNENENENENENGNNGRGGVIADRLTDFVSELIDRGQEVVSDLIDRSQNGGSGVDDLLDGIRDDDDYDQGDAHIDDDDGDDDKGKGKGRGRGKGR